MREMTSEQLAWKIRRHGIEMTNLSGGSHIASVMSVADIMGVLYSTVLRFDSDNPDWKERDRVILSKGHAGAAIYAALAENGFFQVEELRTHYQDGSRLSGHVSHHLPGVDFSTGSLGHGISAGAGMAFAAKKDGARHDVYVVMGDGECDEGSVWEAALFANHYELGNLKVIIDHNHMQSLDYCERTLKLENLMDKWKAFGWYAIETDGNNHEQLKSAFKEAREETKKPVVIIANTVKGKGISFMENDILWHYRFPHKGWEYDNAVNELHKKRPEGTEDSYTPQGTSWSAVQTEEEDREDDHTLSNTWKPDYWNGK